jgi:hypothetical protein
MGWNREGGLQGRERLNKTCRKSGRNMRIYEDNVSEPPWVRNERCWRRTCQAKGSCFRLNTARTSRRTSHGPAGNDKCSRKFIMHTRWLRQRLRCSLCLFEDIIHRLPRQLTISWRPTCFFTAATGVTWNHGRRVPSGWIGLGFVRRVELSWTFLFDGLNWVGPLCPTGFAFLRLPHPRIWNFCSRSRVKQKRSCPSSKTLHSTRKTLYIIYMSSWVWTENHVQLTGWTTSSYSNRVGLIFEGVPS